MPKRKGGDCYAAAAHVVIEAHDWKLDEQGESFILCHGSPIGRGPIEGVKFGHAWVEVNDTLVIDQSNGNNIFMDVGRYYAIGQIKPDEVVRYTPQQLAAMIREHKTYGPWHETEARHANDRA